MIQSWGLGVNTIEPIERVMELEEAQPDVCLSATQYTLLQHEDALQRMLPKAVGKGIDIIVGSPFNSGVLLGGDHYNYAKADSYIVNKVKQLEDIAKSHDVSLKAAALQFSTAHSAVKAVIPGSTRPEHITEDVEMMKEEIPASFWNELVEKGFISAHAPLPSK